MLNAMYVLYLGTIVKPSLNLLLATIWTTRIILASCDRPEEIIYVLYPLLPRMLCTEY